MQGLGNALFEEMVFERRAAGERTRCSTTACRRFADLPGEMTCVVVENGDGPGPFGAKGCGEGALAAVPAAVVNALADAGVPMNELPLTPERVWRRIQRLSDRRRRWRTFKRAAVIGTGTMGPGMGAVLARAGHPDARSTT